MAKSVYYNTKTTATCEMSEKDFNDLKPALKSRYRLATEDEVTLHNQRAGKTAAIDKRYKDIEKRNDNTAKAKQKKRAEIKKRQADTKPVQAAEATTGSADSEGA